MSSNEFPAQWRPDPYGRAQQRWWDGSRWTEHIANGGQTSVDPLGATASIPFAGPVSMASPPTTPGVAAPFAAPTADRSPSSTPFPSTPSAAGSVDGNERSGFIASIGAGAYRRPDPSLRGSFGAVGGIIAAVGLAALFVGDSGSRSSVIVAGLLLIGAGVVVRAVALAQQELATAAVPLAAVGIVLFAFGATVSNPGSTSALIVGLLCLTAWVAPPFRGTGFFLGAGMFALVQALATEIGSSRVDSYYSDYYYDDDFFGGLEPLLSDVTRTTGIVLLVAALVFVFVARAVDRAGYLGLTAPIMLATLACATSGSFSLLVSGRDLTGPFLVVAVVGAIIAFVAARGAHRASTWWGATMAGAGAIGAAVVTTEPSSVRGVGILALAVGAVIVFAPRVARMLADSNNNGGVERPRSGPQ